MFTEVLVENLMVVLPAMVNHKIKRIKKKNIKWHCWFIFQCVVYAQIQTADRQAALDSDLLIKLASPVSVHYGYSDKESESNLIFLYFLKIGR